MTPDETSTNAREEIIKELLLRKQQRKKDWNKNIFSVRTNDTLASVSYTHLTLPTTPYV